MSSGFPYCARHQSYECVCVTGRRQNVVEKLAQPGVLQAINEFNEVKSSGQPHTQFDTGSRRDNRIGKGRFDLLSPIVMKRDAVHMENGARKYDARNWEKGQPLSVYFDSAIRHMYAYLEGHRDEDHLAAARWNIGALIHTEEMVKRGGLPRELADMPNYLGPFAPVKESPTAQ